MGVLISASLLIVRYHLHLRVYEPQKRDRQYRSHPRYHAKIMFNNGWITKNFMFCMTWMVNSIHYLFYYGKGAEQMNKLMSAMLGCGAAALLSLSGCSIAGNENVSKVTPLPNHEAVLHAEAGHTNTNVKAADSHHFSYTDQEEWQIVSGNLQSPIDILTQNVIPYQGSEIQCNYENIGHSVVNNGHSIQVELQGTAEIDDRTYELKQVHFHAQSEHTINGQHFPVEGHFVHTAQDGSTAVIGVMLVEGRENQSFQQILDAAKEATKGATSIPVKQLDLSLLLPSKLSYYHYLGSLTTPPLTEHVEWYVLTDPVEISQRQINEFSQYYSDNNRNTQSLQGRNVFIYE